MREHSSSPRAGPLRAPLLICGASGTLGQALARAYGHRDIAHVLLDRRDLDIVDEWAIAAALDRHRPWAVINAAGWVRVDAAEDDPEGCFHANATGAIALARAAGLRHAPTVHFSSDLVFDGRCGRALHEDDLPAPLNAYGRSKAAMEQGVSALPSRHLVVRTAAFFSSHDEANFAVAVVRALRAGQVFRAATDQVVSPTYVPALADMVLDLLIDGESGLCHLANRGALSWEAFALMLAAQFGLDPSLVTGVPGTALGWRAARPANSTLVSSKSTMLGPLDEAVAHFHREMRA